MSDVYKLINSVGCRWMAARMELFTLATPREFAENRMGIFVALIIIWLLKDGIISEINASSGYYTYSRDDVGSLTGDVQNWATLIQNYILQVGLGSVRADFSIKIA